MPRAILLKDYGNHNAGEPEPEFCTDEEVESLIKRGIAERLPAPAKHAEKPGPQNRAVPVKP